MSNASELFAQSSSLHRQAARGRALRDPVWTLPSRRDRRICANVPPGGGIEISMRPAFVAAEDDAGHLACGQFMYRSVHDRDLLVSGAQFPPQVSGPPH